SLSSARPAWTSTMTASRPVTAAGTLRIGSRCGGGENVDKKAPGEAERMKPTLAQDGRRRFQPERQSVRESRRAIKEKETASSGQGGLPRAVWPRRTGKDIARRGP